MVCHKPETLIQSRMSACTDAQEPCLDAALLGDMAIRKLPLVDGQEVDNLFKIMEDTAGLGEDAREYLQDIDDLITTQDRAGAIHNPLRSLMYSKDGLWHDLVMVDPLPSGRLRPALTRFPPTEALHQRKTRHPFRRALP